MTELNTTEIAQKMLLTGKRINKFDFLQLTKSVCLAQRIKDIRKLGWDVKHGSVEGKGTLREYWLEPTEITRLCHTSS